MQLRTIDSSKMGRSNGGLFWVRSLSLIAVLLIAISSAGAALAAEKFAVPVNRSEMVTAATDLGEVIVADPEIADIYVHGVRHVSVIGKKLGATTVRLFDDSGNLVRELDVHVTYDLPAIRKAIREFLPYERIGVEMINTKVALTGEVSNASVAHSALEIAEQYTHTKADASSSEEGAQSDGGQVATVPGSATIINLMRVTSGQQVMLRIRVGEIERNALKNLGVNMQAVGNGSNLGFSLGTGGGTGFMNAADPTAFGAFNQSFEDVQGLFGGSYVNNAGNGLAAMIEALERDGLFKTLAEPNLVSLSGETAEFLAGGEFPVPVPQDNNTISIEFKPFGVAVEFTPYVLSENRIRMHVRPEVSELNNDQALQIQGFVIPGITTRRASTTIELAPGESFMIAGLIKDTMQTNIDQIPGISEIPILSALFRSASYQRKETELVLAVTPYVVDPMRSSDVKLPTDDFRPASFMETVFYGALGSLSPETLRNSQAPNLEGPVGFMVD